VVARLSAPVQTGPGAHPASHTADTGSFPEVKLPGRGVGHPIPSSGEVKDRVKLFIYSPSGPSWFLQWLSLSYPLLSLRVHPALCYTNIIAAEGRGVFITRAGIYFSFVMTKSS
jgi:hypothetical protein